MANKYVKSCTHDVVRVLDTDGNIQTVSVCQISEEDITENGRYSFPLTGECL